MRLKVQGEGGVPFEVSELAVLFQKRQVLLSPTVKERAGRRRVFRRPRLRDRLPFVCFVEQAQEVPVFRVVLSEALVALRRLLRKGFARGVFAGAIFLFSSIFAPSRNF